jgi:hypothetical protein
MMKNSLLIVVSACTTVEDPNDFCPNLDPASKTSEFVFCTWLTLCKQILPKNVCLTEGYKRHRFYIYTEKYKYCRTISKEQGPDLLQNPDPDTTKTSHEPSGSGSATLV